MQASGGRDWGAYHEVDAKEDVASWHDDVGDGAPQRHAKGFELRGQDLCDQACDGSDPALRKGLSHRP